MKIKDDNLENELEFLYSGQPVTEEKIDRIWKKVEIKADSQAHRADWRWRLAAVLLGVLLIAILAIGPNDVWAQVVSWLIPDYRPVSQLENYQIVPEKTKEVHEELTLSLLSVQSFEDETVVNILVQGISYDETNEQRYFEPPYLLLENGEIVTSIGGSTGVWGGATEYLYEMVFPPLGNETGSEVSLVVPDLPFISVPLKDAWVVSMTIDPVNNEDQVPVVVDQAVSYGNPEWVEPEIVSVKNVGIRKTEILLHFDMPADYLALPISAPLWWSLRDEDGQFYPIDSDLSFSNKDDSPEDQILMMTASALPTDKTYTLTMPRFTMMMKMYGDFYKEDGVTYLPDFLTINFPENFEVGDFINVDQWYDIPPFQFHLLGVEILHIDEEMVRFRIVTQSPESANALVDIVLCPNRFPGGGCDGRSTSGEKRPQADELIYNEAYFPTNLLHGEIGFYLFQTAFTYFPDWELNFDL